VRLVRLCLCMWFVDTGVYTSIDNIPVKEYSKMLIALRTFHADRISCQF